MGSDDMGRWVKADGSPWDAAAKLRQRWLAGRCVCCGGHLSGRLRTLGEGVQICGFCHESGHVERPGEAESVLCALVAAPR